MKNNTINLDAQHIRDEKRFQRGTRVSYSTVPNGTPLFIGHIESVHYNGSQLMATVTISDRVVYLMASLLTVL